MSADNTRSGHFVLLGESNSGALGGKLGEIHTFSAKKTVVIVVRAPVSPGRWSSAFEH